MATLLALVVVTGSAAAAASATTVPRTTAIPSCRVIATYRTSPPQEGLLALTATGEVTEISELLVPTTVEKGQYRVSLTRTADDLYEAPPVSLVFRTRGCHENADGKEVIVQITSTDRPIKGRIVFASDRTDIGTS